MSINPVLTRLGDTQIEVSAIGVGAWAWGDRVYWNFGRDYQEQDIRAAYTSSLLSGVNFIDTAEVYGLGRSERYIGRFLREESSALGVSPPVIATKFSPFPWRLTRSSLVRALRGSLRRMGLEQVDLYQIHWPFTLMPIETWAEALAEVVQAGLARAVGVSNFNAEQTRRAHAVLARHQIPLATNQLPYSLLDRKIEFNRTLQACKELNITVLSYSPLAQGALSGKYTSEKPPSGIRSRRYNPRLLAKIQPLISLMEQIGQAHQGKSPAQVALNWTVCKGTLPIPGAKNETQALENAAAMGWSISPDEIEALDRASEGLRS